MSGFEQKCPACGMVYYLDSKEQKKKKCECCSKIQIAYVEPIEHKDPSQTTEAPTVSEAENLTEKAVPQQPLFDNKDDIFGDILGGMNKKLTLMYGGRDVVTLVADNLNGGYMLGRSANLSEILCSDNTVGNNHCYLIYENNSWYVYDNSSLNGTSVNGNVIGSRNTNGGNCRLNNGDLLRLGHSMNCITFVIKMEM